MSWSQSSALREAGTSQPARRPVRRRLSLTHVLIAAAVVLAFVLNMVALQERAATTLVAIADRSLAAGSTLSVDDVRLVPIGADFDGLAGLINESGLASREGWVLTRNITAGGLLDADSLARPGTDDGLRTMAVPVAMEHAAGGTIAPWDRVDIIVVADGVASYAATDIEVVAVSAESERSLGSIGSYHLVLAVDADQALVLAEAIAGDGIEVVKSTGAPVIEMGVEADEP